MSSNLAPIFQRLVNGLAYENSVLQHREALAESAEMHSLT